MSDPNTPVVNPLADLADRLEILHAHAELISSDADITEFVEVNLDGFLTELCRSVSVSDDSLRYYQVVTDWRDDLITYLNQR